MKLNSSLNWVGILNYRTFCKKHIVQSKKFKITTAERKKWENISPSWLIRTGNRQETVPACIQVLRRDWFFPLCHKRASQQTERQKEALSFISQLRERQILRCFRWKRMKSESALKEKWNYGEKVENTNASDVYTTDTNATPNKLNNIRLQFTHECAITEETMDGANANI